MQTGSKRLTKTSSPVAPNSYKRWTAAEDERLAAMEALGIPPDVIAAELGRTEGAIERRARTIREAGAEAELGMLPPWVIVAGAGAAWALYMTSAEQSLKRFADAVAAGNFGRAERIAARLLRTRDRYRGRS